MTHTGAREKQRGVLEATLAILRDNARVLGVVAAGSCARGLNDAFSDLDIGCYLRDEEKTGREELYDRVAGVGPLLSRLWVYDVHALYLFESGVRLDLDFCRPSDLAGASYGYADILVLHDPDGVLARSLPASAEVRPAEHPRWFEPGDPAFLDWFFWMFRQIVCWAKRGEQGSYRAYDKLSSAADSVAQVRTRLCEMRLWTLGSKDYLARADPTCAENLARTFPRLEAEDLVRCARLLLDEYERIGGAYCAKAGASFPARKAMVTRGLIAEFAALGGAS